MSNIVKKKYKQIKPLLLLFWWYYHYERFDTSNIKVDENSYKIFLFPTLRLWQSKNQNM